MAKIFDFKYVISGTFVRSSYQASTAFAAVKAGREK